MCRLTLFHYNCLFILAKYKSYHLLLLLAFKLPIMIRFEFFLRISFNARQFLTPLQSEFSSLDLWQIHLTFQYFLKC